MLVLLVPAFAHVGPIESAVDRVLEVAVGCITALAVSLLVPPARAHSVAIEAAARALELMAKLLPELFQGFLRPLDSASIQRIQDSIGQAVAQTHSIADEAKHERIGLLAAQPDLGSLRRTLLRLRHDFVMFGRADAEPLSEAPQARLGPLLLRIKEGAAAHQRRSADALAARREPPPLETSEAAFDECARMIATLRDEGLTLSMPVDAAERLFTLGFALEQMRQDLRDLDRSAIELARRRVGVGRDPRQPAFIGLRAARRQVPGRRPQMSCEERNPSAKGGAQ